jgi:hypothetical protein
LQTLQANFVKGFLAAMFFIIESEPNKFF